MLSDKELSRSGLFGFLFGLLIDQGVVLNHEGAPR
jgi:hypothetical protein